MNPIRSLREEWSRWFTPRPPWTPKPIGFGCDPSPPCAECGGGFLDGGKGAQVHATRCSVAKSFYAQPPPQVPNLELMEHDA
jgi:hypothetical protein